MECKCVKLAESRNCLMQGVERTAWFDDSHGVHTEQPAGFREQKTETRKEFQQKLLHHHEVLNTIFCITVGIISQRTFGCLLYTSDAADE